MWRRFINVVTNSADSADSAEEQNRKIVRFIQSLQFHQNKENAVEVMLWRPTNLMDPLDFGHIALRVDGIYCSLWPSNNKSIGRDGLQIKGAPAYSKSYDSDCEYYKKQPDETVTLYCLDTVKMGKALRKLGIKGNNSTVNMNWVLWARLLQDIGVTSESDFRNNNCASIALSILMIGGLYDLTSRKSILDVVFKSLKDLNKEYLGLLYQSHVTGASISAIYASKILIDMLINLPKTVTRPTLVFDQVKAIQEEQDKMLEEFKLIIAQLIITNSQESSHQAITVDPQVYLEQEEQPGVRLQSNTTVATNTTNVLRAPQTYTPVYTGVININRNYGYPQPVQRINMPLRRTGKVTAQVVR